MANTIRKRIFVFFISLNYPGTIKRSTEARSGTEQMYHSKKLLIPMILFANHELPFMVASYALTGRFNPEHELEEHPNAEAADIEQEIRQAKSQKDASREAELEAVVNRESAQLVGTTKEWKQYREEVGALVNEAISREIIPNAPISSAVCSSTSIELELSPSTPMEPSGWKSRKGEVHQSSGLAPATSLLPAPIPSGPMP